MIDQGIEPAFRIGPHSKRPANDCRKLCAPQRAIRLDPACGTPVAKVSPTFVCREAGSMSPSILEKVEQVGSPFRSAATSSLTLTTPSPGP